MNADRCMQRGIHKHNQDIKQYKKKTPQMIWIRRNGESYDSAYNYMSPSILERT